MILSVPPLYASDLEVEWQVADKPVDYQQAVSFMQKRADNIFLGQEKELIWLVEHPPLFTAGTSARDEDLVTPDRFPVYKTGRGGQYTYHGPGQRVVYIMLNLNQRKKDVRLFVRELENWLIDSLALCGISGEIRDDRVGIWVKRQDASGKEDKIAALGIRLRKWVSFHGMSINIHPDLEHFSGIIPCGISEHGVTSIAALKKPVDILHFDMFLKQVFLQRFGPVNPLIQRQT